MAAPNSSNQIIHHQPAHGGARHCPPSYAIRRQGPARAGPRDRRRAARLSRAKKAGDTLLRRTTRVATHPSRGGCQPSDDKSLGFCSVLLSLADLWCRWAVLVFSGRRERPAGRAVNWLSRTGLAADCNAGDEPMSRRQQRRASDRAHICMDALSCKYAVASRDMVRLHKTRREGYNRRRKTRILDARSRK
ncbi:hypothetical protein BD289DRAFT_175281 [Coniella lustricola]|uniref:Uncharacterized protein n=1 Tax=Coniella lustricola TaxID=2025994 RepID=A0A2T3ADX3_9PEZI|nr:hypothetical protein BD289DRAFT_175281 [Coniella lustricola]